MRKRGEQINVYMRTDVRDRFNEFRKRYPNVSDSALINAAMEFYLPYAERGVDGNLLPYTLETAPDLNSGNGNGQHVVPTIDQVRELIQEAITKIKRK